MSQYYKLLQKVEQTTDMERPSASVALDVTSPQAKMANLQQHSTKAELGDCLRFWTIVVKHRRVSAMFGTTLMILVILFTIVTRPVYEPVARLEIDPPGAELFSLEQRSSGVNDAEYLETQAKNLQSDELAIRVIRQLKLDTNADFIGRGVVTKTLGAVLSPFQSLSRVLWKQREAGAPPSSATRLSLTPRENKALGTFQKRLTVDRDTASRLVSISFSSHDPVLAADITNTLVHTFVERTYETRHDAVMESTQWLSRQLDDIREKLEQSNQALADFQQATGIADLDQNRSTFTENMAELSRQKTQAQSERIQIQAYLSRVQAGNSETLPQIQASEVIQQLTQKLAESRAELANIRAVNGPNHPNTKKLQNQVDELQAQIRLQQSAIVAQLQTSEAAAAARERSLDAELRGSARQVDQMARYAALKKEAEANAALYNSLYSRIKEAGIAAASTSSNIRIVDQARVLDIPTQPRPLVNIGVGLLVALCGGIGLAFVREALDNRIHTAEDLRSATGLTVSVLPLARDVAEFEKPKKGVKFLAGEQSPIRHVGAPPQFILDRPGSLQAEAMRGLQTTIMLSHPQQPPQALLVASSLPGEGKTTVAVNLAVSLAKQGRTCLVDADLRRAAIAKSFGISNEAGLADHLGEARTQLDSLLVPVMNMPTLVVMPAGNGGSDPTSLIGPDKVRWLVSELRERFEYIVIDSPPILPYADGRIFAPFVDGLVIVGRAGVITRNEITRTMELLNEVHSAPVLELVLNGADANTPDYQYYNKRYH